MRYRLLLPLLLVAAPLAVQTPAPAAPVPTVAAADAGDPAPPPIRHVFVINLENKSFDRTFGPSSAAPYLAKTLTSQGAFLRQYFGTGHNSLDNYITQISGQAPNSDTQGDCPTFRDVTPATPSSDGQVVGTGCVYPASVLTIADQLESAGMTWKGYMQDMGNDPAREPATCAHPTLGANDGTQAATPADSYATRHNPFVYFHSIIDRQAVCDARVVPFSRFANDIQNTATTANLTYVTPSLCEDGHDAPCADGRPGGLTSADQFLQQIIPQIQSSPAYKADGLIVVTFDESDGASTDSTACCNEPTGPNTAAPGVTGPGGGRTGSVLISRFIAPGTVTDTGYNHYSLLRSLENIFGLTHLGYAAQSGLQPFGADIYTNPTGAPLPGYLMTATDGGVFAFGSAAFHGSLGAQPLNQPIVGMAATPDGAGYWLVASDGGVFAFGSATFKGSLGAIKLNKPIVAMAAAPDGAGYWLVASDGGLFAFGSAAFKGSLGAIKLNKPIVAMAATPDGGGYWMVASDGGVFGFGSAAFFGSLGAQPLNKPIVAMAAAPDGGGYWLVATDGGVFGFGSAPFKGSLGAITLNKPIVSMATPPDGAGYWLMASDGGVFAFGSATFAGSLGAIKLNKPIVAAAA